MNKSQKRITVLSLFDGLSCGQLALSELGLQIDKYYASEIEKNAIQITQNNFPKTIQLGDINDWKNWNINWKNIDLLLFGFPCQSFSLVRNGKGFEDERGKLFFIARDILNHIKNVNPNIKFLAENVPMKVEIANYISKELNVGPILLNSEYFSAQIRERLYWTNIPLLSLPEYCEEILLDILQFNVDEKYYYKEDYILHGWDKRVIATLNINGHDILKRVNNPLFKCQTLTAVCGGNQHKKVLYNGRVRKLTPLEYERLMNIPDEYTSGISDSARYKMIGNGWEINTIKYLLQGFDI